MKTGVNKKKSLSRRLFAVEQQNVCRQMFQMKSARYANERLNGSERQLKTIFTDVTFNNKITLRFET